MQVLLSQSQILDQAVVAANILTAQVGQQPSSLHYQTYQTALGTIVMPVSHHMSGQLVYSVGQYRYLHLG